MRRVAFAFLTLFRKCARFARRLSGKTPADVASARIVSGKSWDEFCMSLRAAGAALNFPGSPQDPFSQTEGYRYLSRLVRAGLMAFVEYADDRAPVIHRVAHETVKLGADNPDNYYQTASINGAYEYRIRGRRNSIAYLSFGTQSGNYGEGRGLPPTGHVEAQDLEIDDDGHFEIFLSAEPQEKNWLPMTSETGTLVIRQTFLNRDEEIPAELHIERINCEMADRMPMPLSPEKLDAGLRQAGTLVTGASLMFSKWARDFKRHSNELPLFDPDRSLAAGGDPNITYYHSHWQLEKDEALLIEVVPPACEYWNFQLNNYWMESLDYRYHRIHTNKHLAHYEVDGSVCIVVSHVDPGLPNWLETTGHTSGTMCFRWIRAENPVQPSTQVVKLTELGNLRT
ncbi:MAG: DUF1214 domain-containing protein [Gammaproteobacteria bacterium]|nr:DUF1214 domain-containing protein [Gammaproteobacteria bacterium]